MLIEEIKNNRILHYSDSGYKIRQIETGRIYDDANDIIPCPYTYEETDIPLDPLPESEVQTDGTD